MKSKNILCGLSMASVLQFGMLDGSAQTNPILKATPAADRAATNTPSAIPWNQIGAKASADYKGDGLAVTPTEAGARLHCVFQRLDGEATSKGLWLTSTVTNTLSDRFRVTATEVSRTTAHANFNFPSPESSIPLAGSGEVSVCGQAVRFSRPGLTEEYSVSMDGVRQDFIVDVSPGRGERGEPPISPFPKTSRPPEGELVVKLAVDGVQVEPSADGARLVLDNSGRKIAYSRLRATDATGKELPARIEVASGEGELAVVVNDAGAVYPVRIDPTFSDANWAGLGGLSGANGYVLAAVTDGSGNLYIGGTFTAVGSTVANNVAEWNGTNWSALGSGISGVGVDGNGPWVAALAVSGSTLFAGGNFTTAGGSAANDIAQWNGSSWSALGSGMSGGLYPSVYALGVSGGTLYAGGIFTSAGGVAANYIAQWNGSSWSPLSSGVNSYVLALAVSGNTLYAGGEFTTAGGNPANGIAQWNGNSWSALGSGLSGQYGPYVSALAVSGGKLYAGGTFTTAGGITAYNIAEWNGNSWSALGSGIGDAPGESEVYALAVSGGKLYAGGNFGTAGGIAANGIAEWNGSSWSPLSSGMNSYVLALAVSGNMLYAGGQFTTSGGTNANYIAQWDGSSWSALSSGLGMAGSYPFVHALAVSGGTLYAGGDFTDAGGVAANFIAQWNGTSWSALGSGMDSPVLALAVSGGTLYAGGDFTNAGGVAANFIAQWNGTSWSALGSGTGGSFPSDGEVRALVVSGGTLYAGGFFTNAGGIAANYIAQWNGSSWLALGSGMNNPVLALAASGGTLYAGGEFTTAGTNAAAYAAMADLAGPPVSIGIITTGAAFGFTNGVFGFNLIGPAGSNVVIQASTDVQTWVPLQTNLLGSGPLYFSDTNVAANVQRFYRALLSP